MPETEYRDVKWGSILKQRTSDLMSFPEKTFMHTSVLTRKLVFFSALFPPCRKKKKETTYISLMEISALYATELLPVEIKTTQLRISKTC